MTRTARVQVPPGLTGRHRFFVFREKRRSPIVYAHETAKPLAVHKSSGLSPVTLDRRANIRGPIRRGRETRRQRQANQLGAEFYESQWCV